MIMNSILKKGISLLMTGIFAASAAVISSAKEAYDFSENNMVASCAISDGVNFDFGVDDGGNASLAAAYLTRWDGPVSESSDPFPASGEPYDIEYHKLEAEYHLQDFEFIPLKESYLDNAAIKKAIMNHGAVYSSFLVDESCFNGNSSSYYLPERKLSFDLGGHAVAIIGWDDNYSRNNFRYKPDGDGAFICKNSWGDATGHRGYFHISYYDSSLNATEPASAFYGVESKNNYDRIYQYDPLGPVDVLYSESGSTIYTANVFPEYGSSLENTENLCAASFYTDMKGMLYEVYAVTDYKRPSDLRSGLKVASGVLNEAGYHTVEFSPVQVLEGTRFAVVVKLKNRFDDFGAGTYIEYPLEGYSSEARAAKGESFYSYDNKKWTDLTDETENADVCIKAFTKKISGKAGSRTDSVRTPESAVNNSSRKAHSSKVYTVSEAVENGGNLSEVFVDYMTSSGSNNSFVPSPVVVRSTSAEEKISFPEKYDLRKYNCVTSMKDQQNTGTCWAFAVCASLESCMLKSDAGLTDIIGDKVYGVKANDIKVRYRQNFVPEVKVDCDAGEDYFIEFRSKDESVVIPNGDGTLYACGTGKAEVEVIVKDYYGNRFKDTITVESKYEFWQWLIRIFLLGFLWY